MRSLALLAALLSILLAVTGCKQPKQNEYQTSTTPLVIESERGPVTKNVNADDAIVQQEEGRVQTGNVLVESVDLLLEQYHRVAQESAEGRTPAHAEREAAMVAAWGKFLEEHMQPVEQARTRDLCGRTGEQGDVAQQLSRALAEYQAGEDTFSPKRGTFLGAYFSSFDGTGQFYVLHVPEAYDPSQRYPLEVIPHHHLQVRNLPDLGNPQDRFVLVCSARGLGIMTVSELDIREAIRHVQRYYTIDSDRIYLRGGSIYGGAVWRMLARYPDLWAGALIDFGWSWSERLALENVSTVPLWLYHDTTDTVVPIEESRAAAQYLADLGAAVIYTQTTGGGHSTGLKDTELNQLGWLWNQRRVSCPKRIVYTTTSAERGRAYWLNIVELTDPNAVATVSAQVGESEASCTLHIEAANIDGLQIDLPPSLFPPGKKLSLHMNGTVAWEKPPPGGVLSLARRTSDSSWHVVDSEPLTPASCRPYSAAGLNLLYTRGEPLLIVRGTGGDPEFVATIDNFCRRLARRAKGWWPDPPWFFDGGIPIKTDTELTAADMARCNLIVVGHVVNNSVLADMTTHLPAVEEDKTLIIGTEKYPLQGRGYALLHYNPQAPQRLMLVLSSHESAFFNDNMANVIWERAGDDRPFGLLLMDLADIRWVRQIAWDKQWKIPANALESEHLPKEFSTTRGQLIAVLQAFRRSTGADYCCYFTDEKLFPGYLPWDVNHARWSDLRSELDQDMAVYVGMVQGADLTQLLKKHMSGTSRLALWPEVSVEDLDPKKLYKVSMDPRLAKSFYDTTATHLRHVEVKRIDVYTEVIRANNAVNDPGATE
ncbi:MAG: hypothetical protein FWE88_08280 [Phycisphaerae bacterium]|nr:hypothetical protein [Phycisphaerae bacterium]